MRSLWVRYDKGLPCVAHERKVRDSYLSLPARYENLLSTFRHKKVAHPNDVSTWNFPPGMLDLGSEDDDDDDDDSDEGDLETDIEAFINSLMG